MLYRLRNIHFIIKRTSLLCALLFAAILALLTTSAQAQCTNWDASGKWLIIQGGGHTVTNVAMELEQKGGVITGTAQTLVHTYVKGTVDGTIDGDTFSVQIFWPGNLTGVYNAKVLPSGRLDGETYDKNNTKIRQPWHSEGVLKCAPPPVQSNVNPQPPKPKPLRATGRARKEPAPPPMKVPGIVASQVIFLHPGALIGSVTLTWDAGPDHPYAEVWVKVNNGDDTFVVELGKGTRQVIVERGKSYEYILTDAGKTLATVGFFAY